MTKLKIAPSKWDEDNLHRHEDYKPIKKEALADLDHTKPTFGHSLPTGRSGEDEFGGENISPKE